MQTLSLFSSMSLFTNKQAPTFKASAVSEGVSTFTAPSRLLQDTVSFAATPKIRSGAAVAPPPVGELSPQQRSLITEVFKPYLRLSTYQNNNSNDSLQKALKREIGSPSYHLSPHLKPQSLLRPHLPEPYRHLERFQMTIAEDHPDLERFNQALVKAKERTPQLPSDGFLALLGTVERAEFLRLQSPELFSENLDKIFDIISPLSKRRSKREFYQYRSDYFRCVEGVEQAENALRLERVIQQRLLDLDVFRKTAEELGLEKQYIHAFRQSFTSESGGKLPFNSRFSKLREEYEALLRVIIPHPKNKSKYNDSFLEHIAYNALETVFSQDRQEKVKQVLGLLEKSPEAVVTFIEELRLAKP